MKKEDVLSKIHLDTQATFKKAEVMHLINMVTNQSTQGHPPFLIKKGDVYRYPISSKIRPCVVIKVFEDYVYSIPLSTTEDELNLCKFDSRFFGKHYFSNSISIAKIENVKKGFLGVLDNNKNLNLAIKILKEKINNI